MGMTLSKKMQPESYVIIIVRLLEAVQITEGRSKRETLHVV